MPSRTILNASSTGSPTPVRASSWPFCIIASNCSLFMPSSVVTRGTASVSVECERALTLKLRIPAWSRSTEVSVDGAAQTVEPGYAEIALGSGRHDLDIAFDFRPRLEVFPYPGEPEKLPEWHRRRFFNGQGDLGMHPAEGFRALWSVGPLKLARSKLIGNDPAEWADAATLADGKWSCNLIPVDLDDVFAGFKAEFTSASGETRRTLVCDFASAGNVMSCDPELFSMFF